MSQLTPNLLMLVVDGRLHGHDEKLGIGPRKISAQSLSERVWSAEFDFKNHNFFDLMVEKPPNH